MVRPNIHPGIGEIVPIEQLQHYPGNARRGQVEKIATSLRKNGQYKPVIVRRSDNVVLVGNHTVKAARRNKWPEVAVAFVEVDDDRARAIVLIDNKSSDDATNDAADLLALVRAAPDLEAAGFTPDELDALILQVEPPAEDAPDDADVLPDVRDEPVTRAGDVWELGRHRVICGDATVPATWARLFDDGARADVIWTDPPYGVNYVGKTADAMTIDHDQEIDLVAVVQAGLERGVAHARPGAPAYVCSPPGPFMFEFYRIAEAAGLQIRQGLVWVKNTMVLGHSDYHYQHEPILEAQTPEAEGKDHDVVAYGFVRGGAGRLGRGGPRWYGDNAQTTVFEFPKPPASREHPTMKPVRLVQAMLRSSLRPGGTVVDMFGGAGSTLIAAEYQGAACRMIELSPRFVDVICARYQAATGEQPTRDGIPVDFEIEED